MNTIIVIVGHVIANDMVQHLAPTTSHPRPALNRLDRLFWTTLRSLWSRWADVLAIDRNFMGDPTASAVIIAPGEEVSRPRFHGTFATHGIPATRRLKTSLRGRTMLPPRRATLGLAGADAAGVQPPARRGAGPLRSQGPSLATEANSRLISHFVPLGNVCGTPQTAHRVHIESCT